MALTAVGRGLHTWTVQSGEKVNKQGDQWKPSGTIRIDLETTPDNGQTRCHEWEGKHKQVPATPGVHGVDGGEGKDEHGQPVAPGGHERPQGAGARLRKDDRRVKGHDVDPAELLGNDAHRAGHGSPAESRDGEEFDNPFAQRLAGKRLLLLLDLAVGVEKVPCGLHFAVADAAKCAERLGHAILLD